MRLLKVKKCLLLHTFESHIVPAVILEINFSANVYPADKPHMGPEYTQPADKIACFFMEFFMRNFCGLNLEIFFAE